MKEREIYIKNNRGFKQKLVYRFGCMGFYSDFNNLILSMLWCYQNKIEFTLYSKGCFAFGPKGWRGTFQPIFRETTNRFHRLFNNREVAISLSKSTYKQRISNAITNLYELVTGNFLMKDCFYIPRTTLYSRLYFSIPELGIDGDILDACHQLVKMIYVFKEETKIEIDKLKASLNLPNSYIGLHIRRGDKVLEQELKGVDKYMDMVKEISSEIKDIFVFTDQYSVIEELEQKYSSYRFFTLTKKGEKGYDNESFKKKNRCDIDNDLVKMYTAMDILTESAHFIGTVTSNPGMFLGMRMDRGKVHYIDHKEWIIM